MPTPNPHLELSPEELMDLHTTDYEAQITMLKESTVQLGDSGRQIPVVRPEMVSPAKDDADAYNILCSAVTLLELGLQRGRWCSKAGESKHALIKGTLVFLKLLTKSLERKSQLA